MPPHEHHVLGLHVAVHESLGVRVGERVEDLAENEQGFIQRECAVGVAQAFAQRHAISKGHHVVEKARRLAAVDERENVGMLQPCGDADLAQESLGAHRGGELRIEDFDGDRALVLEVLCEVHRGHATGTKLPHNPIAIGEGGGEGLQGGVGHARSLNRNFQ